MRNIRIVKMNKIWSPEELRALKSLVDLCHVKNIRLFDGRIRRQIDWIKVSRSISYIFGNNRTVQSCKKADYYHMDV